MPLYIDRGVTLKLKNVFYMSEDLFYLYTNWVDPDKMPHNAAFIWVYTICERNRSGVSRIQRVECAASQENPSSFFTARSGLNQPAQLQRLARTLKFYM